MAFNIDFDSKKFAKYFNKTESINPIINVQRTDFINLMANNLSKE